MLLPSQEERHKSMVANIANSIRGFYEEKIPYRIFHGSTYSTRPNGRKQVVDISQLNRILHIDLKTHTAFVEPNVSMDRLVEATLQQGLIPPVVMEFPGITVGGGYSGSSGESSSFKYGFFDKTVKSVEMVLADGRIITASAEENADLFLGAGGALGTLGLVTLLELQLIEAKKYIKLTYHAKSSVADTIESLHEATRNPSNDYVDAILFSENNGVVMTGEMTNDKPENAHIQTFSHPWDPWYYLHIKDKAASKSALMVDFIPLAEYLFRYDRGGFWVGTSGFKYFKFPFNKYTRWFFDDFLHTRMLYKILHASGESARYMIQDLTLPYSTAEAFIDYTRHHFGIWPLWLCPLKQAPSPTLHPHTGELNTDLTPQPMLNIGLWGPGPNEHEAFITKNREMECYLKKLGGMKCLYAHTYYTEKEFWEIYDAKWYNSLREKYAATRLPSVYDKVKVLRETDQKKGRRKTWVSAWPTGRRLWGIWQAIKSKEYLHHKNLTWQWRK